MADYDLPGGTPEMRAKVLEFLRGFVDLGMETKYPFFRELNKNAKKGGIVFAGDSITEGYPLRELFPRNLPILNRGIGGVTSVHLLQNLDIQVLDLAPSNLFLLIGTNDLGGTASPEETADNIELICKKIKESCKETKIYLISVYPISVSNRGHLPIMGPNNRSHESVLKLNELLQENPIISSCATYIDVHSFLKGADGKIEPTYTTDGLHLTLEGYQQVTKVLMPYVLGCVKNDKEVDNNG